MRAATQTAHPREDTVAGYSAGSDAIPLQALERFLGERFRLLDLRFFLVRPADTDANENILL
jgi:hypothetical protein